VGGFAGWLGGCGGNDGFRLLGNRDAEHLLAVDAFHELAAHLIGDSKKLATAKIRTNELNRHKTLPELLIGRGGLSLD
jgi:hypothetical protein